MAGRRDYRHCKGCGRHYSEVGELSWQGWCPDCWNARLMENVDGLHTMSGPAVKRWRRGVAASVGAVLVDDVLGER